jgi:membrane-bound lytic murein transglycosylase D
VNYVVRRGDSLSLIAGRFRVTVAKLLEWNSLSAQKYLQPGQRLVMYVDVTEQST